MNRFMVVLLTAALAVPCRDVQAQQSDEGGRGPRFLLASAERGRTVRLDVSKTPVLRAQVTLALEDAPLKAALAALTEQSGIDLIYSDDVLPPDARVTLHARGIAVAAALTHILLDARVDVVFLRNGTVTLSKQPPLPAIGTITGTVTEAKTRNPVPLAQVSVSGTSLVRTTDESGRYAIAGVQAGTQTITVRRLGYDPLSREVVVTDGGSVTADFALVGATTRLAEIVTTVTGGQRRVEMGNTVATVRADSLMRDAPVMSFGDLIQGRAPGVLSMQSGSNVGQAGTIRIRGLNSFGVPNDPILVVDGVRVESSTGNATVFGVLPTDPTAGGYSGRLADLNPNEIASVEVVKGSSAATLYGTDAANGVLVITTKRGQAGRARWMVFTEQGILEQRLENWGAWWGGAPYYAFGHNPTTAAPQRCTLLQRAAGSCVLDSLVSFNPYEQPDTRPFRNGTREQYGLQLSGGTAGGATYFLSGHYEQEIGTAHMPPADQALIRTRQGRDVPDWQLRPNAFDKVNVRTNLTFPLGQRGTVALASGFVSNQSRQPGQPGAPRLIGYRDVNDGWRDNNRPAYSFAWRGEDVVRRFLGSLATTYSVRAWLSLRGTVGADLSTNAYGPLLRRGEDSRFGGFFAIGRRTANELAIARYSLDLGGTATHALSEAVSSKTSVGIQYNRRAQRGTQINASNLPLGGETIAGAANPLTASEATLTTAVAGSYVEEMLGFRDRLFLTGAVRFDGASAFGKDFSVAAYPKASISWLVTNGETRPNLTRVSSLRLRTAYGVSGVQPGPFAALQQIQVVTGLSGTTPVPAAQLGAFGNADLRPERTSEIEAGFDLEAAAGRARLEFTAYQRTSHDGLINRTLAQDVGGGSRWENIGSVRNRGLELQLGADVLRGPGLSAGFVLTGLLNENTLLELGNGVVASSPLSQSWRQDVGYPLQGLWGRTIKSVADANGNGIIEPGEFTVTDNHYIGPGFPTREATASPYIGLFGERLRFNALLQYRGGFYVTNFQAANACRVDQVCRAVNDQSAPLADQARAVAFATQGVIGGWAEPGSYLSLRELSAGLNLPASWPSAVRASEARIVLAARNVAVLWRAGRLAMAPENTRATRVDIFDSGEAGAPTYWLLRLTLNY